MARKLDQKQTRELTAFVAALKELGGYTVWAEWARDSGYPATNLSKLANGVGSIDGYNLLRLIRAAADRAGLSATATASRAAAADDRSGQGGWRPGEREAIAEVLELLDAGVVRLNRLLGGQGHAESGGL